MGLGGGGGRGGAGGGGGRGCGAGGQQGGVRAHLVDVDVGGVEQDVVLPAEAGEDGGDARHQLGEGGPPLRLRVPALDHHRVAGGRGAGEESDGGQVHFSVQTVLLLTGGEVKPRLLTDKSLPSIS